ncbi:hypothetical protein CHUAL_003144 [Chamberlinius hualienensis]
MITNSLPDEDDVMRVKNGLVNCKMVRLQKVCVIVYRALIVSVIIAFVVFAKQLKNYIDDLNKQQRLQLYMEDLSSVYDSMRSLESKQKLLLTDIESMQQLLEGKLELNFEDGRNTIDEEIALEKPIEQQKNVQFL